MFERVLAMTDENLPTENDLVALEIGRAILNAQVMADRIVADARRRADEISQPDGHTPASGGTTSRVALIPREEAVAMLRELDSAERELQVCQAELVEFLDRCLQNLEDPGRSGTSFDGDSSEPNLGSSPGTTGGDEVSPLDLMEAGKDPEQKYSSVPSSGDIDSADIEIAEPELPSLHEAVEAAGPNSRSEEIFWARAGSGAPWNSAELEDLRRPAFQTPPSAHSVQDSDDGTTKAGFDSPPPLPSSDSFNGLSTEEPGSDATEAGVSEMEADRSDELSRDAQKTESWAPPSGLPVTIPESAFVSQQVADTDPTGRSGSEDTQQPAPGVFRRLASLPNMLALAGTLVVLLVLLILVQTL
jgi:hypothetical protein